MTAVLSMLILSMIALGATIYLLDGMVAGSLISALLVILVISLVNTFLKPLTKILGAKLNPIALVIFSLILNVLLFCLAAVFGWIAITLVNTVIIALVYSVVMTLLSAVMYKR